MNLGDKRMAVSGWRLGRCRAKVQIGAVLLCKGAKVRRQWLVAVSGWRLAVGESQEARGDRIGCCGTRFRWRVG